ncbi:MAG: hypothetical protein JXB29_06400 [Sedimentisphaerales bacterium]|nr:hypothetical protein [Sedimentisphaerales bacterium]
MNPRYYLIAIFIAGLVAAVNSICYSCPPTYYDPEAILTAEPEYVMTDVNTTLDGSDSYDVDSHGSGGLDGIVKFEWDFEYNNVTFTPDYNETSGSAGDGAFDGKTTHSYSSAGTYIVMLKVTDNDDPCGTDTDTCTVYVNMRISVPDDVSTIQGAIDVAIDDTVITVSEGIYYETIDFNVKNITLTGTDPNDWEVVEKTIIDANGLSEDVVEFDSGDANSTLTGLTIRNGRIGIDCRSCSPTISKCLITCNYNDNLYGGGMYCYDSSAIIDKCIFRRNETVDDGGAISISYSTLSTTNCAFIGNLASGLGAGIYNEDSVIKVINCIFSGNKSKIIDGCGGAICNYDIMASVPAILELTNCTFNDNSADYGGALYNYLGDVNVTNCIFWGNQADTSGGEIYNYVGELNFRYCDIEGGIDGNKVGGEDCNDVGGNFDSNPKFIDANNPAGPDGFFGTEDDGLHLLSDSNCIDRADSGISDFSAYDMTGLSRIDVDYVTNNGAGEPNYADVGAYESLMVWFVDKDASGTDDGSTWANAYQELQDALSKAKDVNDGGQIWVADGNYRPTDGNDRTASFELVEAVAVYGGFDGTESLRCHRNWTANITTLTGDINIVDDANDNCYHVVEGANDATLDGFIITKGMADGAGADANRYGGGIYWDNGSIAISNCSIIDNDSSLLGGGIYNYQCTPVITNCFFSGNSSSYGGALYNRENTSTGWLLTNCVFTGNSAWRGGGVYNDDSSPAIVNCTLHKNSATSDYGGGIYNGNSSPTITNCIFWDNDANATGDQICNAGTSSPTVTYSDVQGGYDGTGNINSDPCFIDANNADGADDIFGTFDDGLRIKTTSGCIDAANGSIAPAADALGYHRCDVNSVSNTGAAEPNYADIGAYESGPALVVMCWIDEAAITSQSGGEGYLYAQDDSVLNERPGMIRYFTDLSDYRDIIKSEKLLVVRSGCLAPNPDCGTTLLLPKSFGTPNEVSGISVKTFPRREGNPYDVPEPDPLDCLSTFTSDFNNIRGDVIPDHLLLSVDYSGSMITWHIEDSYSDFNDTWVPNNFPNTIIQTRDQSGQFMDERWLKEMKTQIENAVNTYNN